MNTTETKQLKNTWLVQRLRKPYGAKNNMISLSEAFSFGGGLKNGGLSEDAMDCLRPIFSFDYMGSAEFEFGAIPKFFQAVSAKIKNYRSWSIEINGTEFFVIGKSDLKAEISDRIVQLSNKECRLKEWSGVDVACGKSEWTKKEDCRYIGWLELDNEFMFFSDKNAFKAVAHLFGVNHDDPQK